MKPLFYISILILALFSIVQSSCTEPGAVAHMEIVDFTVEHQNQIGDIFVNEVMTNTDKFTPLEEIQYSSAYLYLNTLFNTLLTTDLVTRRNALDWDIIIINDDSSKSIFTAPGGKIFVYSGFLKFVNSESELLSVLAHEIYYANSNVAINRLAEEVDDGFIFGDLILGNQVNNVDQLVCTMRDLRFRESEIESADNFSVEVLCNFQYDANGLKKLLAEAELLPTIEWTSTRPLSVNRINNIMNKASICGADEDTFTERYQEFIEMDLP